MASRTIEEILRLDATQAVAAFREVAESGEAAAAAQREATREALNITSAETQAAAALRATATAETVRAEALGVTLSQMRAMHAASAAMEREQAIQAERAREAAAAWGAQTDAAARLEGEMLLVNGTLRRDGDAHEASAGKTKGHAAALTNLRFQLTDIGTQLASGASPGMILAQQGPQVAEAIAAMDGGLKGLMATIAGMAPVLGVLAVGLGAIVAVYVDVTREMRLEGEEMKTNASIAASQVASVRANEDAHLKLAKAIGLVSQAYVDQRTAALNARDDVKQFGASQSAERERLRGIIDSAESKKAFLDQGPIGAGPMDRLMGWTEEAESARRQLAALDRALVEHAATVKDTRETTQNTIVLDDGTGGTGGSGGAGRSRSARAAAAPDWMLSGYDGMGDSGALQAGALAGIEKAARERADVEQFFADEITKAAKIRHDADMLAIDIQIEDAKAAEEERQRRAAIPGSVLSTAAGGAGGIMSAVQSAGPIGATIAGSIQLLDAIGNGMLTDVTDFTAGLADSLSDLGKDIAPFLKSLFLDVLPSLVDAFPQVITSLLEEVPQALFQVIADPSFWKTLVDAMIFMLIGWQVALLKGLVSMLGDFFRILVSPEVWVDIGRSIADAVRDAVADLVGLDDATPNDEYTPLDWHWLRDDAGLYFGTLRDENGRWFAGLKDFFTGSTSTSSLRGGATSSLGGGFTGLLSGAAGGAFARSSGSQVSAVGGGLVFGKLADIADKIRRDGAGRGISWGT